MAESFKDQRIQFEKGMQSQFLRHIRKKHGLSIRTVSEKLSVHPRTYSDWEHEQATLPKQVLQKIMHLFQVKRPRGIQSLEAYWYTKIGAPLGAHAVLEKYGRIPVNEVNRKQKWVEWWERTGKHTSKIIGVRKPVRTPRQTKKLAEIIGILLGDGCISSYQVTVTLNNRDDAEYALFVQKLMHAELDANVAIYKRQGVFTLCVSSISVVENLLILGMHRGNKIAHQVNIPDWIQNAKKYWIPCIRGLWDTDGCIYEECHHIRGKKYCYPRLSFVSHSKPLRDSVCTMLSKMDFSPKIRNNRSVNLERREDIVRYFEIVGSSNPKHSRRFKTFCTQNR